MATDSKDVELRVRARDLSGKTLDQVTDALHRLEKAQDAQLASAKKGEQSAKSLENSYREIEKAVQALVTQNALVEVFNKQAAALEKAKKNADDARKAQVEYEQSLAGVEAKTKEQIKTQAQLARAVAAADKRQVSAQNNYDKTSKRLEAYGIAADQASAAQQRIVAAVNSGNAALDRQQAAIDTIDQDIQRSAALQKAAADEKENALRRQAAAEKLAADTAKAAAEGRYRLLAIQDEEQKSAKKVAEAERLATEALRKSAQQAEATAKGYQTLARAVKSISGGELKEQLQNIVDPAGQALKSLSGLETTVTALAAQIGAINGPVREFRATLAQLEAAQKAATGIAQQIDAYQRQIAILRQARSEYSQAQAAVRALTAQMRAGGGDAAELSRQLAIAQNALKAAAQQMGSQLTNTTQMRESLRAAGVDTRNLGDAQARLVKTATDSVGALNRLTAAYRQHGAAAESAAKSKFKFFEAGRTTLSLTQRLKGEILALAAAYVGVQGAISTASGALDAIRTKQKIQSGLLVAFGGDTAKVAQELVYLREVSDRIGVSFVDAAPAYAKLSIAARSFGFNLQETRFVFEKFAIASRDAGLSGAEFEGVLKAVEQMLSKGKIQAEELRGQLGDRLPGAFTVAAKAAGKTTEEFTKMLETGEASAELVINIARELGNRSGANADAVAKLVASEAQFKNALFDFQVALAEGGFLQSYTKFLQDLTAVMKSEEGKQFAQFLSNAFTAIIDVITVLIKNIDEVKIAFSVLFGLAAASWFMGVAKSIGVLSTAAIELFTLMRTGVALLTGAGTAAAAVGTAAAGAATGVGGLTLALRVLLRVLPGIGLLVVAIEGAIWAYKKLSAAKKEAESGAPGLDKRTAQGKLTDAPTGLTTDPGSGSTAGARAAARIQKELDDNQEKLDKARKSANARSAKDQLAERASLIREEFNLKRNAAKTEVTDATAQAKLLQRIDAQEKQALLTDQIKFNAEHAKSGAAAANKEVTLKEQVKNELLRIEDELAKDTAKLDKDATFEQRRTTRIEAISHAYDKLKKTISQLSVLDKAAAADATKKLDIYIQQRQAQEDIKVTGEEVKRLDKELADQIQLRTASLEKEKQLYESGQITQEQFLANTAAIQLASADAVSKAANNLQKFADAVVATKQGLLSPVEIADIQVRATTARAGAANPQQKIDEEANKALSQSIDAMVAQRTAAEELFARQFELRMIGEDEYAKRVNANSELYKAKLLEQIAVLVQQMEVQRAQGVQEGTLTVEKLAALDAQIAKYQLLGVTTANTAAQADLFQKSLNQFVSGGIDAAFNSVVDSLTKMAQGQLTVTEGFKAMGRGVLTFVAQFLAEIAKAIAKQLILNALVNSGNPYLAAAGRAAGGVPLNHGGGTVGRAGGMRRRVDPSIFAGAPRLHEGGVPGLKSNEIPTILERGEQVLARDDPNNVLNAEANRPVINEGSNRFVLLDDQRNVAAAMQSAEGEKAQLVILKKNAATIRQIARG